MYDELRVFFELRFSHGSGWTSGIIIYLVTVLGISLAGVFLRQVTLPYRLAALFMAVVMLCPLLIFPILTNGLAKNLTETLETNNAVFQKEGNRVKIFEKRENRLLVQLEDADYQAIRLIAKRHNLELPAY